MTRIQGPVGAFRRNAQMNVAYDSGRLSETPLQMSSRKGAGSTIEVIENTERAKVIGKREVARWRGRTRRFVG